MDEIIGQEHITTTLKNALKNGAISHAYLFTGLRGTGKTSVARILAHELNGLPYTGEDMHLDIIEIDAASNRGIDEIRDLREKVTVAPTHGKYKVYIIDEVHMLTTPAFNALLKTLEEPPAHVVFILATTESHKLPETIISRTQRYNFRPVELAKVIGHLQYIAKKEGLGIDDAALELIAEHGEGSFRDSISLLNQAASHSQKINAETIQAILGLPPQQAVTTLFSNISDSNKQAVVQQLGELYQQGYQAGTIAKQLAQHVRSSLLSDSPISLAEDTLYTLLARLIDVPASPAPERLLEIVLLQACPSAQRKQVAVQDTTVAPDPGSKIEPSPAKPKSPKVVAAKASIAQEEVTTTEPKSKSTQAPTVDFELDAVWPELLKAVKIKHNTVYGILRMAIPELSNEELLLTFKYAFHQKRMQEAKHKNIISDTIQQLTGKTVAIECRYDKNATERKPLGLQDLPEVATNVVPTPAEQPIATISNIFGGGELLES
ncbi:hypothetical protein BH09PAT4_BH09PAT4_05640 [soil metagenome]